MNEDRFSVAWASQVLAMLGRDPAGLREDDRPPRGWHGGMFSPAVGSAGL